MTNWAVGDVLRVRRPSGFGVYLITGIHLGAQGQESAATLQVLDRIPAAVYGKCADELIVPLVFLEGAEPCKRTADVLAE